MGKYKFDIIPDSLPTPFEIEDAKEYHGFRGKPLDKIWFGVEIELEYTKITSDDDDSDSYEIIYLYEDQEEPVFSDLNKINDLVGKFAVIKHDGSLKHGIEIATAPCSFEIQLENWQKFYKKFSSLPLEVCDTCGMHVHVSRRRLTDTQIDNIIDFVASPKNRDILTSIAGRSDSKYCKYELNSGHYDAVNTENDHTIEFRLFRSPDTFDKFARNLQLIRGIIDFCGAEKFKNDITLFEKFVAKKYGKNQLRQYCVKHKIFEIAKTTSSESKRLVEKLINAQL